MSRRWWVALATAVLASAPQAAAAQQSAGPPETIDLLLPRDAGEDEFEDCSAEQEAASISGEIVVCRRRRDKSAFGYDNDSARQRYAAETMDKDSPRAPDFAESCKKNPEKGACISFGRVPPPAYIVDFAALPETPAGSDADRVGRGLAPNGALLPAPTPPQIAQEELGLAEPGATIPAESASPAVAPSG